MTGWHGRTALRGQGPERPGGHPRVLQGPEERGGVLLPQGQHGELSCFLGAVRWQGCGIASLTVENSAQATVSLRAEFPPVIHTRVPIRAPNGTSKILTRTSHGVGLPSKGNGIVELMLNGTLSSLVRCPSPLSLMCTSRTRSTMLTGRAWTTLSLHPPAAAAAAATAAILIDTTGSSPMGNCCVWTTFLR